MISSTGQGPVVGCCECGDEPSGSCTTELVSYDFKYRNSLNTFYLLDFSSLNLNLISRCSCTQLRLDVGAEWKRQR
jgi:hypothetical protein